MFQLADLFSSVQGPDFLKFVVGALIAGSIYLIATKVGERIAAPFVRKADLKTELDKFKLELMEELVSSHDLEIFALKQAAAMEAAMKESRHSIKNDMNAVQLSVGEAKSHLEAQLKDVQIILARVDEHFKTAAVLTADLKATKIV